ncbi:MAG: GntR family transcriptional regulator [Sphingomonadales bacterium]|nr:GntR family transcriptional regulator [Sphingomonadales bacterium]
MNAGQTSERVYDALKERLLSGDVLPGDRLEPAFYADALGSSATPVRDALHRLVGEHLVDMRLAEGFFLPLVTEPGLRSLYMWNLEILRIALRLWTRSAPSPLPARQEQAQGESARDVFARIAVLSGNSEIVRSIAAANDRLATARVAETRTLPPIHLDLSELRLALYQADIKSAARHVIGYHRTCVGYVPQIVQAIYNRL